MLQQPVNEFQLLLKALGYLRTHWWVFLLELTIVYGSALNTYHKQEPVYESYASILIDNSRRQLYQAYMMPGYASNARKQNMAHLLSAQEVTERLRNQLADYYNAEGRPEHLRALFPGGVPASSGELREMISLTWDRNSDIYQIRCATSNPDAAHDLCLAYMNTIQTYYPEIGQREAMMKRDFLSRQIASLTRQITEREGNLAEFQKRSPDFMTFLMMDVEDHGRQRLRGELEKLKESLTANRAMKNLLLKGPAAKRGEHGALQPAISALTARVSELQYQIKLTEQSANPDREQRLLQLNEALREASAQLAELNDEEVQTIAKSPISSASVREKVAALELEYRVALIRQQALEKQIIELNEREKKYQQQRLEYDRLKAELTHRRKLLQNLYAKEQQAELELSAGNAEIFRLQEPTRNSFRVSPQLTRYLYGSFSMCLFIILATTVLLMAFFPRLDSEAEVNRLNLPVIGKVPLIRRGAGQYEEMSSFGLEFLKIMNYRILRETKDMKCPVVIVTSAHAREGKSTVAHMLALASHAPNRRALLIDGDLLTAHPNRFFGIQEDHTPGLQSILNPMPDAPPPETLDSLIVSTTHEGISFMPRGERIDPVAMPNYLKPFERHLDQLRRQYDIIFVDTPPLFASNLAHQWAGIANLIVLVGRLYVTRPRDITEAIQTCKIFSKAPVGVALNCVPITGLDRRVSNYYFSKRKTKPTRMAA